MGINRDTGIISIYQSPQKFVNQIIPRLRVFLTLMAIYHIGVTTQVQSSRFTPARRTAGGYGGFAPGDDL
jgi:hypothetical protein